MNSESPSSQIAFHCLKSSQDYIKKNLDQDVNQLYLSSKNKTQEKNLIDQIFIRQKIKKKLPKWSSNFRLIFTKNISYEQSSSEATSRLKSNLISGNKIIDLTGGMGVDTYYFSKSFEHCLYCERQELLANFTRHNFTELGVKNVDFFIGNSLTKITKEKSDYIYIDPARRDEFNSKLISLQDCDPNVISIKEELISNERIALVKASPMLDISLAIKELKYVYEVWVLSHRNETKEIIFCLKSGNHDPLIRTFNILPKEGLENFDFRPSQLPNIKIAIKIRAFLYEPNSSMQKAKGGEAFAEKYGLEKLDSNTNLYFSDELIDFFPGKIFEVLKVHKPYDKSLKKGRFNIISRNFPDKADVIQSKMKIKPSKNDYLIACKTPFTNYIFIQASHKAR